MWKGDDVSYNGLHRWLRKNFGHPKKCQHCGMNGKYNYSIKGRKRWNVEWANKSGNYLREISDWLFLCRKCHIIYDKKNEKI